MILKHREVVLEEAVPCMMQMQGTAEGGEAVGAVEAVAGAAAEDAPDSWEGGDGMAGSARALLRFTLPLSELAGGNMHGEIKARTQGCVESLFMSYLLCVCRYKRFPPVC